MRAYLLAVVAVAACGGGGDGDGAVYGVYQTTSHVRSDTGCSDGAPVADPPFFSFEYFATNQDGFYIYAVHGCPTADESTCGDATGVLGLVAEAPVGWFAFTTHVGWAGNTCTLEFTGYTASFDGETFQLDVGSYRDTTGQAELCTDDEANRRGATMPCVASETLTGTHL